MRYGVRFLLVLVMNIESIAQIRKETKLPMFECKEALEQEGSAEKAIEYLKTKKRDIPEGKIVGGTCIHLINRPPYTIIDTRRSIDNTKVHERQLVDKALHRAASNPANQPPQSWFDEELNPFESE